ncbi:MAG: metallophosphoesterase [Halobacteriales archaeon]|nr:metallophosphoesterase [Halobacteriales archaeon]
MATDAGGKIGPVLVERPQPRSEPPVRIGVIADPHLTTEETGTWKVLHRTATRLRTALGDATDYRCDLVVFAGDLTRDGHRSEFEAFDTVLGEFNLTTVAIPGNHDVRKAWETHDGIDISAFTRRYASGLPFAMKVGSVTVFGVNTASTADGGLRETWGGRVSEADQTWLADRLPSVEAPIVVLHHNLGPLPEHPGGKWRNFPLQNDQAVRELLAKHDVPLAVTGHHHVPAVRSHGTTTEVMAPAVCSYPQAWIVIDVTASGTTIRLAPLADQAGVKEARRLARTGKPLGQGVLELVESRLTSLTADADG